MSETRLRRGALAGLMLAAVGLLVPGFYHIRCGAIVRADAGGSAVSEDLGCQETFPGDLVVYAALVGLVGTVLALYAALSLAREAEGRSAARVVLALASLALLVPTVLPIAGWAAVGFDLSIGQTTSQGNWQCSGGSGIRSQPLWLQTPTCLRVADLIVTPLGALAGTFAALAARRGSTRWAIGAIVASGAAIAVFLVAFVLDDASPDLQWLVPLLGAGLVLIGLGVLLRAQPTPRSA